MRQLSAGVDTSIFCDACIREELEQAVIDLRKVPANEHGVPYSIVGTLGNWTFYRNDAYWVALAEEGKGLPEMPARVLNGRFFGTIRVGGMSGGDDVARHLRGGTVNSYHIDDQESLNAFALVVAVLSAT